MPTLTDFATRLKNARLTKGWSMDKLCENMDPPVSKMRRIFVANAIGQLV